MISVSETFTEYKFHADEAATANSFRYGAVSHTALNSLKSGQATQSKLWISYQPWTFHLQACLNRLTNTRYLKLLFFSSLKNLSNMDRPKLASLIGLVVQTSLLTLTTRYSRTTKIDGPRYLTTTVVVSSEITKAVVCLLIVAITARRTLLSQLALLTNYRDVVKSCVPSLLYTLQNNLQFVAMNYLDAATFQITYQLKILTTAVFSVCFLRRHLDAIHWTALVLLILGVTMVQFPRSIDCTSDEHESCNISSDNLEDLRLHNSVFGVICVLAMCVSSGFAGVYVEKMLKASGTTGGMWIRNLQLAMTSMVLGVMYMYAYEGDAVSSSGFFQGYDMLTWVVILQQAFLGLLTSLVMKYADNIVKGFASAIAIVATTFISYFLLNDLFLSCSFLLGTVVVMAAALLYNVDRNIDLHSPEAVI